MKTSLEKKIITGIDIGSTHITLVSGHTDGNPENVGSEKNDFHSIHTGLRFNILGMVKIPNSGLQRGRMVSLVAVTESLLEGLDELERQTGIEIESARVGISSAGAVTDTYLESISIKNNEVKYSDCEKISASVKSQKPPSGKEFIHVLGGGYILDGKSGIRNPLGMYGTNLESVHHRVMVPQSELTNLIRACNCAGIRVEGATFEALAASQAVLTEDEKELGSSSISIGAESTHVALYSAGFPVFSKDYPLGSHHITKDLAIGLRTTQSEAERVKREIGKASYYPADAHDQIQITSIDSSLSRSVNKGKVCQIIEPRVREILNLIFLDLNKLKLIGLIPKGIVLTGGGSRLNGVCVVAEEIFSLHARVGHPLNVAGLLEGIRTPSATAAVGLLSPMFANVHASRTFSHALKPSSNFISRNAKNFFSRFKESSV